MTVLDPLTGLPALPPGQIWEVAQVSDEYGGYEPGDSYYNYDYFRVSILQTKKRRFLFWSWTSKTPIATAMVNGFDGRPVYLLKELSPDAIRRTAESIVAKQNTTKVERAEAGRRAALLGTYPPNKLGGKS